MAAIRWEYRRVVLTNLGLITVVWAGIEMVIDHLIAWYHPTVDQVTIQEEQPVNFMSKLAYINKMARDEKFDNEARTSLHALKREAKILNKARKLMIHGVASHPNGFSNVWNFSIREFNGPKSVQRNYPVKDTEIAEILHQMSEFSAAIAPWVWGLTHSTDEARAMISSAKSE